MADIEISSGGDTRAAIATGANSIAIVADQYHYHGVEPPRRLATPVHHSLPNLPAQYRARPTTHEQVLAYLLQTTESQNLAAAVGIYGMGGLGKTVCAAAIVADRRLSNHFTDGMAWLSFGRGTQIVQRQMEFCRSLTGSQLSFSSPGEGRAELARLIGVTKILIVLDDVWELGTIDAFLDLGPNCRLLVTTRDRALLARRGAREIPLDFLDDATARGFLADAAGIPETDVPDVERVLRKCGGLPLALAAVGSLIRNKVYDWDDIATLLHTADLSSFSLEWHASSDHTDLKSVLALSVASLPPIARDCFLQCTAFAEDQRISEKALLRLWSDRVTSNLEAKRIASQLIDRSLIERDADRNYGLHDLYRDYIREVGPPEKETKQRLMQNYASTCDGNWWTLDDDGFIYQRLIGLLLEMGGTAAADLFADYRWLSRHIATAGIYAAIRDCRAIAAAGFPFSTLADALQLSADNIRFNPAELPSQLCGRLEGVHPDNKSIAKLLAGAQAVSDHAWLQPLTAAMVRPGSGLTFVCSNLPKEGAPSVAIAPDEHAVAVTGPNLTVRRLPSGEELSRLSRRCDEVTWLPGSRTVLFTHGSGVSEFDTQTRATREFAPVTVDWHLMSIVLSPRCSYVAAGGDLSGNVYIWSVATGELAQHLKCPPRVFSMAWTADEQFLLTSVWDSTVRKWRVSDGKCVLEFRTAHDEASYVWLSCDETRVVAGSSQFVQVFDAVTCKELVRMAPAGDRVIWSTRVSEDGSVAFAGISTGEIVALDLRTGSERWRRQIHESRPGHLLLTKDGRGVSAGTNLRVWDTTDGSPASTPDDQASLVTALAIDVNGKTAVTLTEEGTALRITDLLVSSSEGGLEKERIWEVRELGRSGIFIGRRYGQFEAFDTTALEYLWQFQCNGYAPWSLSSDGRLMAAGFKNEPLLLLKFSHDAQVLGSGRFIPPFEWTEYRCIEFSSGGEYVAAALKEGLAIWRVNDGQLVFQLTEEMGHYPTVAFFQDGARVALAAGTACRLYDIATGKLIESLDEKFKVASAFDGLAVCQRVGLIVELWQMKGDVRRIGAFDERRTNATALFADGKSLAIAREDGCIEVWDVQRIAQLNSYRTPIRSASIAAGGNGLIAIWTTFGEGRQIEVWDSRTGARASVLLDVAPSTAAIMSNDRLVVTDLAGLAHVFALRGF